MTVPKSPLPRRTRMLWRAVNLPTRAFMVAWLGIALLLATPFLTAYSYTVTTTSADAKMITISYVYPLEPFLLVFLALGIVMTTYGLWNSTRLLVVHKIVPTTLGWLAIALA